jgi:hypothetical protein
VLKPIKVFGLGLNRTGTTTLGTCLKRLGYKHVSCDPGYVSLYVQGEFDRLMEIMKKFESCDDLPWPLMYQQLHGKHKDRARYILTTRKSPEVWLNSVIKKSKVEPISYMRKVIYGHHEVVGNEDSYLKFYNTHNHDVRRFFGRSPHFKEFCWENGDDWTKLCSFLNKKNPRIPFPHENKLIE